MTTEYDLLNGRIDKPTSEDNLVHGVAIGTQDETQGMSGKTTRWPGEVLEDAAEKLVGVPIVKGHPGAEKTSDGLQVDSQPPLESKVGSVTDAKYKEDVGLLWQGEIKDEEMLEKVEQGLAEVSPVVGRELEPVEGEEDVFEATQVTGFRDIGLVSRGASSSNDIQMGAAALAREFGSAAPSGEDDSEHDDGPNGGSAQSSAGAETTDETTMTNDDPNDGLSDAEVAILEAADSVEEPVDALNEIAGTEDATVVESTEYEAMGERVGTLEDMMADRLKSETGLKDAVVENMSFEAMAAQFENDDGEFEADALVQNPETGQPNEEEAGVEALSEDADVEKAEALHADMQAFDVDHEDSICDALGVSDFETAEEVLD